MIIDQYTYRARLMPAFIMLAPVSILLYILFPDSKNLWPTWLSVIIASSSTFLLAEFVRERGKRIENNLFQFWGGIPSVSIMRLSTSWLDSHTMGRRRQRLQDLLPEVALPTLDTEIKNQLEADEIYMAYTKYLISRTRDIKKFPLLFKENVSYGFRRNLLALKTPSVLILVIIAFIVFEMQRRKNFTPVESDVVGILLLLAISFIWVFVVTKEWVHTAARSYALQLCESIESM
jgi:hypothetical protein